ncbi:MurT ligase domain-containing protein [Buchananella felis]|uniref:MurT ligase domain-containing protein n=1 Tax=Buchananella felis TaxID=3231492 RepID=UPI003527C681
MTHRSAPRGGQAPPPSSHTASAAAGLPPLPARTRLATLLGNSAKYLSRTLKVGSGGMIGGKVALRLDPHLLERLARGRRVVLVTGTNGKSTTTRMIAAALSSVGQVATNSGGDNMLDGIASAFMAAPRAPLAVLEVDEMHLPMVAKATRPAALVLLNLSRDQLDRVGEIGTIEQRLREAVNACPDAHVIANADDPLIASAAWDSGRVTWVAAGTGWNLDSVTSPRTGTPVLRDGEHWYAAPALEGAAVQTGPGQVPVAEFVRPRPQVWVERGTETPSGSEFVVRLERSLLGGMDDASPAAPITRPDLAAVGGQGGAGGASSTDEAVAVKVRLNLPGRANQANAAQALAAAVRLGAQSALAAAVLAELREVAGRYSSVRVDGREVRLLLAKNPAGWQESMSMFNPDADSVLLAVNGQIPDGEDLSWLWDVDFTAVKRYADAGGPVIACGERVADLSVRLTYAGIPHRVVETPAQAVACCPNGTVEGLLNYTAFRDYYRELTLAGYFTPTGSAGATLTARTGASGAGAACESAVTGGEPEVSGGEKSEEARR